METILKAMMAEELDGFRITNFTKKGYLVLTFTKICYKVPITHTMIVQCKFLNDENEEKTQSSIQYILNKLKET
jgi:hypothetical protein